MPEHRRALMMMIVSGLLLSTMGLVVRGVAEANQGQIVFWRGFWSAVGMGFILWVQNRPQTWQRFTELGGVTLYGGVLAGLASMCFILAMLHTTVANAMFTMSALPMFTALLAWLFLKESVGAVTLLAMFLAMGGIGLMVWDGLSAGGLLGNLLALLAALSAAGFVVILRHGRHRNMLPTLVIGALFSMGVGGVLAQGQWVISWYDLLLCFLLGGVISVGGHLLFMLASRALTGVELTLLTLIEFVLGPVWVWMLLSEQPSTLTLVGGSVVMVSVIGQSWWRGQALKRPTASF
ncbi:DMT family transporter [Magnetococcus sp. PR-3]|uniref:DMT family transporter n=1 Tax=Magnetococcus sp. PR-3 TaxID=3120355 RepID=UPI002FCE1A75